MLGSWYQEVAIHDAQPTKDFAAFNENEKYLMRFIRTNYDILSREVPFAEDPILDGSALDGNRLDNLVLDANSQVLNTVYFDAYHVQMVYLLT